MLSLSALAVSNGLHVISRNWVVTVETQKDEKHRVEHGHLDIQLDQSGKVIDGFSEVHGLGVEVNFFPLLHRVASWRRLQKELGSAASDIKSGL
jgi:hypothetical protein